MTFSSQITKSLNRYFHIFKHLSHPPVELAQESGSGVVGSYIFPQLHYHYDIYYILYTFPNRLISSLCLKKPGRAGAYTYIQYSERTFVFFTFVFFHHFFCPFMPVLTIDRTVFFLVFFFSVIGHGIVGRDIPIMVRLAKARRWSKR